MCGRLLAKRLLLREELRVPGCDSGAGPGEIEIHSLDLRGRPARPRVTVGGRLLPWHLSIAHTRRSVLVAVSCDSRVSVGVDVTAVDGYEDGFRKLWLTPAERRWCETAEDRRLAPTLWAVKEAAYKAANRGERFAPASIEVSRGSEGGYAWHPRGGGPRRSAAVRVDALAGEVAAIVAVLTAEGGA